MKFMNAPTFSAINASRASRLRRKMGTVKSIATVVSAALGLLVLSTASFAQTLVPGDVYVYTSPGVYEDVTAAIHEDPIILIGSQYVDVIPNYTTGVVYDGNGNVIGFVAVGA
jgi:hypothetical protein